MCSDVFMCSDELVIDPCSSVVKRNNSMCC